MKLRHARFITSISFIVFLSACGNNMDTHNEKKSLKNTNDTTVNKPLEPVNANPAWGKNMTGPMAVVIEKLVSFNDPPLVTLSAQEARTQHSPADAALAVINDHHLQVPSSGVDTSGKQIDVAGGNIHLRIYTPKSGKDIYPVIVYYHGGGWVIADLNTYNASAESLAANVDAIVISVAYRQAPENKFPTAHNDSYAAYEWVLKNAASIKGDAKRIAVVGESAGGNLATAVSMMARDKGLSMPVHEVLIYPIAGYDFNTASYRESDSTKPLSSGLMKWFFGHYLNNPADGKSPMISLVTANLKGLPSTTIIAAEYDPLRSEGEMLAENFKKAGVSVTRKLYNGTTHEFFGMAAIVPEAKAAQDLVVSELKSALYK